MKIILSHPTGNANVRAVLSGLAENNMLHEFYTTIATFPGDMWSKLGASRSVADLKRREYESALAHKTRVWPAREVARLFATKARLNRLVRHEQGSFCTDSVYKSLDKRVASRLPYFPNKQVNAVYAYEDCALETFKTAKKLGITCVYDLPIAYWQTMRELMSQEAERLPKWKKTMRAEISDSNEKLDRKTRELELADIVMTPGKFVADSLPETAKEKKIVIVPFGSPLPGPAVSNKSADHNRPLRVLFAGSLGQRKGLGDLFEAIKLLHTDQIELVVLGSLLDDLSFYQKQLPGFTYEPTRPHAQVLKLMASCDVFCLPSIIEGRALVMQEAMSQGLPLIITPNTGGEDLIIEGETGFLVPIKAPQIIAEKLHWFLENRQAIPWMSQQARQHAATYSWRKYANTIASELKNYIQVADPKPTTR
ncbi:glycosyltransferase family 4 protein [Dyadobacter sp. CY326]|uniref:glycosyltransferase family 4 protein n=1 Tax=Dyadobacter sp. CY326 TaxID=2907300 RepID=UPI001F23EF98|nr:glycosyltransferase family 4 protein [Dyadobacter sp. CY326]MCE7066134.1 glycosyltransferase family 4 protein [Dyadobacter sp. CY326]